MDITDTYCWMILMVSIPYQFLPLEVNNSTEKIKIRPSHKEKGHKVAQMQWRLTAGGLIWLPGCDNFYIWWRGKMPMKNQNLTFPQGDMMMRLYGHNRHCDCWMIPMDSML